MDERVGHMTTALLKHACVDSGQYGLNISAAEYVDAGVRLLRTTDLSASGRNAAEVYITGPIEPRFIVAAGDLLLSRAGTIGQASLVAPRQSGSSFAGYLVRFRPLPSVDPRYLYYSTQAASFQQQINADAVVSTIANFNADRYANLPINLPGSAEQRRIADFLDDQVARIDNIIAARLLQAITARVVLDLGIFDDLNDLRRTTKSAPLRRFVRSIVTGSTPAQDLDRADGLPWYTPASMRDDGSLGEPLRRVVPTGGRSAGVVRFSAGSVAIVGIGATAGKVSRLDHEASGNQQLTAISPATTVTSDFLYWQLRSRSVELLATAPFTTLPIINNEVIASFDLVVPEHGVQLAMAARWHAASSGVAGYMSALRGSARLLTELKRSLITAAITGEFDVSTADGSRVLG